MCGLLNIFLRAGELNIILRAGEYASAFSNKVLLTVVADLRGGPLDAWEDGIPGWGFNVQIFLNDDTPLCCS